MLLQPQSYAFACRTLVFVKINAYFSRRIERLIVTKKERHYTPISNFSPQKAIKLNSKSIKLTNWVKRVRVIKKNEGEAENCCRNRIFLQDNTLIQSGKTNSYLS